MCSPVYDLGAGKQETISRSINDPSSGSRARHSTLVRGASGHGLTIRDAIEKAPLPDNLITAIALRPGAVASATIVSSSSGNGLRTLLVGGFGYVLQVVARLEDPYILGTMVRSNQQA